MRFLQVALNTHLRRNPPIDVDGDFGAQTEQAVRDYQRFAGLTVDGVVGKGTWAALQEPATVPAQHLRKFQASLGAADDFVEHVRRLEPRHPDWCGLMDALADFSGTPQGARYLLTSRAPGIVDFRHFFAAASEAQCRSLSRRGLPLGAGRGDTLPPAIRTPLR